MTDLAVLLVDGDGDGLDLGVGLESVLTQLTPDTGHLQELFSVCWEFRLLEYLGKTLIKKSCERYKSTDKN